MYFKMMDMSYPSHMKHPLIKYLFHVGYKYSCTTYTLCSVYDFPASFILIILALCLKVEDVPSVIITQDISQVSANILD